VTHRDAKIDSEISVQVNGKFQARWDCLDY